MRIEAFKRWRDGGFRVSGAESRKMMALDRWCTYVDDHFMDLARLAYGLILVLGMVYIVLVIGRTLPRAVKSTEDGNSWSGACTGHILPALYRSSLIASLPLMLGLPALVIEDGSKVTALLLSMAFCLAMALILAIVPAALATLAVFLCGVDGPSRAAHRLRLCGAGLALYGLLSAGLALSGR